MLKKRVTQTVASATAALMLLSGSGTAAAAPAFTDVPAGHWAWKNGAISWGVSMHVISGYGDGTFKPNRTVTEAEFLRMLVGLYVQDLEMMGKEWTEPYYKKAHSLGYPLAGLHNTKARHTTISRTQVAELIAAADGVHYSGNNAIQYVLGKKLAFGKVPGETSIEAYRGKDPLTRAEAVQLLKTAKERGLSTLKARPAEPSDPALLPPLSGGNGQSRPAVKDGIIYIEGMPEKITLKLFKEQNWPFTTYYPSDMIAEKASSGEGDSVQFIVNFNGYRNDKAFMNVYFPANHSQNEEDMVSFIQTYGYKAEHEQQIKDTPWAIRAYAYTEQGYSHRLLLGKHAGRYFIVQTVYPVEYGDGMAPRTAKILEEWLWKDSGKPLSSGQ